MIKKITYDMTGQQIGKLKVLKPTIFKKDSSIVWECLCNCGFICFVNTKHLRRKLKPTRSCGCGLYDLNKSKGRPYLGDDLTGMKFGLLIVIGFYKNNKHDNKVWKCYCECGNTSYVTTSQLRRRNKSCGCLSPKNGKIKGKAHYTYNGYEDITGTRWNSIVGGARVRNLEFEITKEFIWELYLKQNMRCKYSNVEVSFQDNSASIDRVDNNKGYLRDNVAIVHKDVNRMKSNFDSDYFVELCSKIHKNKNNI